MLLLFSILAASASSQAEHRIFDCPADGYFAYPNSIVTGADMLGTFELDEAESGERCSVECYHDRRCGFFHVSSDYACVMFRGEFSVSLLQQSPGAFAGVPCAGCPAKGYLTYPNRAYISGMANDAFVASYSLQTGLGDGQGANYCHGRCIPYEACEVFAVVALKRCITYDTEFREASLVESPGDFVGVPCHNDALIATESPNECPDARYIIHQDRSVGVEPDDVLIFEAYNAGERCFQECSRQACGFFEVDTSGRLALCSFFDIPFDNFLLLDHSGGFVGVPCQSDDF